MGTPRYPTLLAILVGVGEAALSGQPAFGRVDVLELDVVEDDIVGVGTPLVQVVEVAEKDVVTKGPRPGGLPASVVADQNQGFGSWGSVLRKKKGRKPEFNEFSTAIEKRPRE